MPDNDIRIYEVTFCSRVSKWADSLFADHPDLPLHQQIVERLAAIAAKAGELARSRTGDAKRAADLARLLAFWMTHGKPRREPKPAEAQEP